MAGSTIPDTTEDVETFIENVDEVHRLIEGLKAGTLSPEYIDSKTKLKHQKDAEKKKRSVGPEGRGPTPVAGPEVKKLASSSGKDADGDDQDTEQEAERKERAMTKVKEIVANRERKLRARAQYEEYVKTQDTTRFGTDYTKWDIWCPDDEEDDLINSIGPSNAQFRAMEKDIDDRHRQMVERRQLAERCRVAGNAAYGSKQYSEALRCYQQGLDSERTNMALHANAAMAALKINCFVQAIEHCDKALSIAEFFQNNKRDPLCVKALQRRAEAFRALQQTGRAVTDLQSALELEPGNAEVAKQLARARQEDEEARKQRAIAKAVSRAGAGAAAGVGTGQELVPVGHRAGAAGAADGAVASGSDTVDVGSMALDLGKLGRLEKLAAMLAPVVVAVSVSTAAEPQSDAIGGAEAEMSSSGSQRGQQAAARRGPALPARSNGKGGAAAGSNSGASPAVASSSSAGTVPGTCEELRGLLRDDDTCCVYLRECGGLQHIAARVIKAAPSTTATTTSATTTSPDLAPLLLVLNDACMNDGNLKQLPALRALPAAVAALGGAGEDAAAAAVALLCTAVTNEDVRREVSGLLGGGRSGGDGLMKLLQLLATAKPTVQGVALALLGNCMVDKPSKAAMAAAWRADAGAAAGGAFLTLLRSPVGVLAEKAAVLLGNMATDGGLRGEMLASHGGELVGQLVALAAPAAAALPPPQAQQQKEKKGQKEGAQQGGQPGGQGPEPEVRRAAATALFNLTVEEAGQRLVAEDMAAVGRLYGLVAAAATSWVAAAPVAGQSVAVLDHTLAARAAGVCARAARAAAGAAELLRLGGLEGSLRVAVSSLECLEAEAKAAATSGSSGKSAVTDRDAVGAVLDAAVRMLTILTTPDDPALAAQVVAAGGVEALLRIIRAASAGSILAPVAIAGTAAGTAAAAAGGGVGESVLGNAVLCLAGVARRPEHLAALRAADAVPPLIKVAYDGRGNAASKNAAIGLARLAKDQTMLERLRELHGIEIIYQYVKP